MNMHKGARLTPYSRALLVHRVTDQGMRVEEAAHAAGVSSRTAYKWLRRYREEGAIGLVNRSSRPNACPHATTVAKVSEAPPYRASGPFNIRRGQTRRVLAPGVVPDYVACRIISVRAYDSKHMMRAAQVSMGTGVVGSLEQLFTDPAVVYIHLHNAKQGCFSCLARRA